MEKFIECLKNNDGAAALMELEQLANCFGFYREVPDIVEQMHKECSSTAYIFCAAFVKMLSEEKAKGVHDGRMVACRDTAHKIAESILQENELAEINAMQIEVDKRWVHPTVFQQIAQIPFLFFDSEELREQFNFDESWWCMPLI